MDYCGLSKGDVPSTQRTLVLFLRIPTGNHFHFLFPHIKLAMYASQRSILYSWIFRDLVSLINTVFLQSFVLYFLVIEKNECFEFRSELGDNVACFDY